MKRMVARLSNSEGVLMLHEDELVDRRPTGFSFKASRYPVAGASAEVGEALSGYRRQHHQITVTVKLADGGQVVFVDVAKGGKGREHYAKAANFAAAVNRVGAKAS